MPRAAGFRKTTNQASIAADFQFAMVMLESRRSREFPIQHDRQGEAESLDTPA
jgi:hypothetical protein